MTTAPTTATRWDPPGPGFWEWQGSHVPGVPTPIYREIHLHTMPTAIGRMFERYGVPLRTLAEREVNGRLYASLQPLVGKPGTSPPPKPVLWLAARLHPELRRRAKAAARTLEQRTWRARTVEWRGTIRPALRRTNLALQAEDVAAMDAAALTDHLRRVHAHVVEGHLLHFDLHGDDMGPLGLFLSACRGWGIDPGEGIAALTGHSPSTMAAVEQLRKVALAAAAAGGAVPDVRTVDDLRALGPEVAGALDEYLEEYGWRVVTGYDLDAKTVGELPEVLVTNVRALATGRAEAADLAAVGDAAAAALRTRVTGADRARFDELLGEARTALDLRDDNGPMTVEWPVGLLRRAVLEAGRRAVARGALRSAEHALELTLEEVLSLVGGAAGPGADAVADRAARRATASAEVPPATLGTPVPDPDLSAFPAALATVVDMAVTCVSLLERASGPEPGTASANGAGGAADVLGPGLGVGAGPQRGRARVAHSPEEALAGLEPGEVLVVPFTTPAYNAVLAVAGALVTEEGGALSHAAVLARELELPAVIGVAGATAAIPDGALVEVDPTAGTVRLVSA